MEWLPHALPCHQDSWEDACDQKWLREHRLWGREWGSGSCPESSVYSSFLSSSWGLGWDQCPTWQGSAFGHSILEKEFTSNDNPSHGEQGFGVAFYGEMQGTKFRVWVRLFWLRLCLGTVSGWHPWALCSSAWTATGNGFKVWQVFSWRQKTHEYRKPRTCLFRAFLLQI